MATERISCAAGTVQQYIGKDENIGEFEVLARQHIEQIVEYADRIVPVDQRRALGPKGVAQARMIEADTVKPGRSIV